MSVDSELYEIMLELNGIMSEVPDRVVSKHVRARLRHNHERLMGWTNTHREEINAQSPLTGDDRGFIIMSMATTFNGIAEALVIEMENPERNYSTTLREMMSRTYDILINGEDQEIAAEAKADPVLTSPAITRYSYHPSVPPREDHLTLFEAREDIGANLVNHLSIGYLTEVVVTGNNGSHNTYIPFDKKATSS